MLELLYALTCTVLGALFRFAVRGPPLPSWTLSYALTVAATKCALDVKRKHTVPKVRRIERLVDAAAGRIAAAEKDGLRVLGIEWTVDVASLLSHERRTRRMFPEGFQGYFVPEEVEFDLDSGKPSLPRKEEHEYRLTAEWYTAVDVEKGKRRKCIIVVHGGAFAFCTISMYRGFAARMAKETEADVLTVEYRKPPERPWPAAIHDVFAAYLYLTDPSNPAFKAARIGMGHQLPVYDPEDLVFFGDSAGGNIALAAAVYLRSFLLNPDRTPAFAMPGGLILHSGWFDLTHCNKSWDTNGWIDTVPRTVMNSMLDRIYDGSINCAWAYVNGFDSVPRQTRLGTAYAAGERLARLDPEVAGPHTTRGLPRPARRHPLITRASSFSMHVPSTPPPSPAEASSLKASLDGSLAARSSLGRDGSFPSPPPTPSRSAGPAGPATTAPHQPTRLSAEIALLSLILHPLVSGVRTADLSLFPPVLIQSASHEQMLDDSVLLADRYAADNAARGRKWVRHEVYGEACHDFVLVEGFAQAGRALEAMGRWMRRLDRLRARGDGIGGVGIDRVFVAPDGTEERGREMKFVDRLHEFVARLCLLNREAR
ncbi:Alpha/Beta hydrolase protein [Hyaloraphidium curvatum]|nr:Alpha/Beta hydrolase protein [Hyaloraphidium curvatum]